MSTTGKFTLYQGTAKSTGNPFTALKLKVGKWTDLHFPTQFERDYLIEYLKTNDGTITLNTEGDNQLTLVAGEYTDVHVVKSSFEYKYIVNYFRNAEKEEAAHSENDSKIDLSNDEPVDNGLFN